MIIGIDPGKKGAIVGIDEGKIVIAKNIPVIGKEYDLQAISTIFGALKGEVYIEKLNAFGMGRQSAFVFGYGIGILEGIVVSHRLPLHRITPTNWQKVMFSGVPRKNRKPKDIAMQVMLEQYPKELEMLKDIDTRKAQLEGLIDAFLIAKFGEKLKGVKCG